MNSNVSRPVILLVDDDPESLWTLIDQLETDYEILCATNSAEALKIACTEQPDLILLDIVLPDLDGYALCERLKIDVRTHDVPIIFLTAKTEDLEEVKGLELGAQDYITKPFSIPVVQARIRTVLNFQQEVRRRLLLKQQLEELNQRLEQQVQQKTQELREIQETLRQYEEKYTCLFQEQIVNRHPKRILAVDDHPENLHILIEHLETDYDLLCATSGKKALDIAFSKDTPDLILLDVMMPEMDGYEVCARLKGPGRNP